MKKTVAVLASLAVATAGAVFATTNISTVASHATPDLAAEVNTAIGIIEQRLDTVEAAGVGGTLAAGKVIIGDASGAAAAQDLSGNATVNTAGVVVVTGAADAFTVTASGTATATFIGADASGAANTEFDTTGAGTITVGSADVTAITLTTDGTGTTEVVLPAASVGQAELDTANFTTLTFDGGSLDIVATTQLVFIAGGVTNVLDLDVTTP